MLLHVTNGDSTAGTLRRTGLGGAVLPWRDALHEGPVPALPRRALLTARASFLAGCGLGTEAALLSSLAERDHRLLDALAAGDDVVLWFEHDLYDQLQLLDVLALAGPAAAAAEAVVVGSFPGRPSFAGLGELTAGELETLWPSRVPVTPAMLGAAADAWDAFRAPDPTALAARAARDLPQLPFVAPALRRLLEELPAPRDGLSRTERLALESVDAGARTPTAAFLAAQRREPAPFLGDTWFFRTLAALAEGPRRLVETEGGLRLTADGERVLAGDADRVELLELDRWLGGTHVTSAATWRWDADGSTLLAP